MVITRKMTYEISYIYASIAYQNEIECFKKQKILKEKIYSDMKQEEINLAATKVESISDPNLGRILNALV